MVLQGLITVSQPTVCNSGSLLRLDPIHLMCGGMYPLLGCHKEQTHSSQDLPHSPCVSPSLPNHNTHRHFWASMVLLYPSCHVGEIAEWSLISFSNWKKYFFLDFVWLLCFYSLDVSQTILIIRSLTFFLLTIHLSFWHSYLWWF